MWSNDTLSDTHPHVVLNINTADRDLLRTLDGWHSVPGLCRRVALDKTLTKWSTAALANGTTSHPSNFRDPSRPFKHADGRWYIVAGSGLTHGEQFEGMVGPLAFGMMFVADDDTLASWTFVSFLHKGKQTANGVSIDTFECPGVLGWAHSFGARTCFLG